MESNRDFSDRIYIIKNSEWAIIPGNAVYNLGPSFTKE